MAHKISASASASRFLSLLVTNVSRCEALYLITAVLSLVVGKSMIVELLHRIALSSRAKVIKNYDDPYAEAEENTVHVASLFY